MDLQGLIYPIINIGSHYCREYLQDDCPPNPDLDTIVPSLVK
jgi:hypothetical protein